MNKVMKDGRLEVSDLMIGDWVQIVEPCKYAGAIGRIKTLIDHKDDENAYFKVFLQNNTIHIGIEDICSEDIRPIPLTKEILEKIGFVCTQKADEDEMGAAYECWSFRDGLLSIEFEPEVVMLEVHNGGENGDAVRTITYYTDNDIMYLHELQHALRLCRIEKTIEL